MKYSIKVQKGLDFIKAIDATELTPLEIRELLHKTVANTFDDVDKTMTVARKEGIITNKDGMCHFPYEAHDLDFFKPKIVHTEESNKCRCCSRPMNKSHYIEFKSGRIGPYGSKCVRKLYLDYLFEEE